MTRQALFLLILINPFALTVYLQSVMQELPPKKFMSVLMKASLISFGIYYFFAVSGEYIFDNIYQIRFESFRVFGGIVFFTYAIMYIVHGRRALFDIKENLNDLASEIALPFMVGAGSISMAILIGHNQPFYLSFGIIAAVLLANFGIIIGLMYFREALSTDARVAFDKLMGLTMRIVGFFVGALGVDMVVTGINNLYFK